MKHQRGFGEEWAITRKLHSKFNNLNVREWRFDRPGDKRVMG